MPKAVRLALALELLLLLIEKITPEAYNFLPFCGDHFTQLAVLIIAAVAYVEINGLLRR